ncbi:hypothetical protein GGR56DRAFT_653814 [Xylariaceae sp. FL0804]|nr:hypothetical protein GGR56DRAFT_653814 [Xylariaceae sp. FL0804]
MNWTEGNLARHSRGRQRNALLARQKQHFAKSRNRLSNTGITRSPVAISFMASSRTRGREKQRHSSSPSLVHKRRGPREPVARSTELTSSYFEKKRRLLEKADWAGLSLQQPLDITFPGQERSVGESRWGTARHHGRRPLHTRPASIEGHRPEMLEKFRSQPLRIQIGSQEIQPSLGTLSQQSQRRRGSISRAMGPPVHTSAREAPSLAASKRQSRLYEASGVSQSSGSSFRAAAPTRSSAGRIASAKEPANLARPETPAQIVYASSVIHEPAPRRADGFTVLQWSPASSEDRGSLQVEIERPPRPVPPSQERQQRQWKDWVLSSSIPDETTGNSSISSNLATLPSLSSSGPELPSHMQMSLPTLDVSSESLHSSLLVSRSSAATDRHQLTEDMGAHQGNQKDRQDEKADRREERGPNRQEKQSAENLDSAWMMFALGDDSEELKEAAFKEATHQAAMELRPSSPPDNVSNNVTLEAATGETDHATYNRDHAGPLGATQYEGTTARSPVYSNAATRGTAITESEPSNLATAGSSDEQSHNSRFIKPRPFIGKLAEPGTSLPLAPSGTIKAKKGRKGRKLAKTRIASDGRTDIRSLPDYGGDPIEEFGEDS